MSRVAYSASVKQFVNDWDTNRFMDLMCIGAINNHIGNSISERKSWEANAAKIRSLLALSNIHEDTEIAFEYKCPLSGRVDCMLFGYGKDNMKHIVHLELKQWSNETVTQIYDTGVFEVSAFVGGSYRLLSHPSQQAYNYQKNILNYLDIADTPYSSLNGYAYCYNYRYHSKPNDLYAKQYKPIIEKCPLNSGDQIKEFVKVLDELLSHGKGNEIFKEFISCPIKPTKNLVNAVANIFNNNDEFVLIDEQLTSSNIIFGMIDKVINCHAKKMALIVKGGPGTGKTVIALKVLAELYKKYPKLNSYFTTRSKALRNTLRDKLSSIASDNGTSASGLIRNIYDFRPANFIESEVDVLLIDEAHRISHSANFMTDRGDVQTYLPQVLSLLYCSKVCVFFIDDNQAINNKEIGTSTKIKDVAINYANRIKNETNSFIKKYNDAQNKLAKAKTDKKYLLLTQSSRDDSDFVGALNKAEKKIDSLKKIVKSEYQIKDVNSRIADVEVNEIELKSQFRCNGSDNYLDWLDLIIYNDYNKIKEASIEFKDEYMFEICKSPKELEKRIRELNSSSNNIKQVARIVAGYCWKWSERLQSNGDLYKDVKIGDWEMPWETNNVMARPPFNERYAPSADLWASHPMGINQVGCIFSAQGFEVDYIGVILGPDIGYNRHKQCIESIKGYTHSVSDSDPNFDVHIKNIYRVLLSRGRKGCLVYCVNKDLELFFEKILKADS